MAYFIDRVSKVREGEGSLLDNCMIVYGSGMADGNAHAHADIPTLLFGKGGGTIDPGRHVVLPERTRRSAICGSRSWTGWASKQERFGDSTGRLSGLTVKADEAAY